MAKSSNSALSRKRLITLLSVLSPCILMVCVPMLSYKISPPQNVLVINDENKPVVGARVVQTWKHYEFEFNTEHSEEAVTNEDGRVFFPERTLKISLLSRMIMPLINFLVYGVHAGTGTYMNINNIDDGRGHEGMGTAQRRHGDYVIIQGYPPQLNPTDR